MDAFYQFHNTHEHSTDKCRELSNQIKALIRKRELGEFVDIEAQRDEQMNYTKGK